MKAIALGLSLGWLALASCYSSSGPQSSGNTNWLKLCSTDRSCDGDASCICGVCTRACDASSECGAPSARCVEVDNRCGAQSLGESAAICLRGCRTSGECGAGQSCEEGSCVASTVATDLATADACDPTLASCRVDSALSALIDQSRKAKRPSDPGARVWSCEGGALRVDPAGYDEAFAIAATGDALLVGGVTTDAGDGAWRVERRSLPDLQPAREFGSLGAAVSSSTVRWDAVGSLATDASYVYAAGVDDFSQLGGGRVRIEKRELASGGLVSGFGDGGSIALDFAADPPTSASEQAMGHGIALDDAGHLYLGGTGFGVEKRRASDGARVEAFGNDGVASGDAAFASVATSVTVRDDVVYAAGPDGSGGLRLEARDAVSGRLRYAATQALASGHCHPQCVALASGANDDLYASVMAANGTWRVERRVRSTGALVYARELEPSGGCDAAATLAIDDTAMYVAGAFEQRWRIEKRRLSDGALVESFGRSGAIDAGVRGAANSLALRDGMLYIAGLEGPRDGVHSSVWRVERRATDDGALIECPAAAPGVPRAPECSGSPEDALASEPSGGCRARVARSNACAVANVRASTQATEGEDWTLPEGAAIEDGSLASVVVREEPSSALVLRGFGFELPERARVVGIGVEVKRASAGSGNVIDHAVRLVRGAEILEVDRARKDPWGMEIESVGYGGAEDVWGVAWSAAEINDPSFGVAFRVGGSGALGAEARVDAVRVEVTYCE